MISAGERLLVCGDLLSVTSNTHWLTLANTQQCSGVTGITSLKSHDPVCCACCTIILVCCTPWCTLWCTPWCTLWCTHCGAGEVVRLIGPEPSGHMWFNYHPSSSLYHHHQSLQFNQDFLTSPVGSQHPALHC